MHLRWKHVAIAFMALPFVVLIAAWIGFFNVGASTGHWKITEWFLHFAMRSAVRTYALAVDDPERLPRDGIQTAAAHFARGCAVCHGAPGEPRSPLRAPCCRNRRIFQGWSARGRMRNSSGS